MRVLVTGGAGYIGSHAVKLLADSGHEITVLDNLSHGHLKAVDSRARFVEGNTGNQNLVTGILKDHKIEAVMHFAANIEVGESVANPGKYYENNFSSALTLLISMRDAGVKKLVFSSTAAVYGNPESTPILETMMRAPINPYGRSKLMTEMAIEDFSKAHGLGFTVLRYFNVAGAAPDASLGEDHQPETHLIPRLLIAARDGKESAKIFGTDYPTRDGTCVRDYVHVMDLAEAHRLSLEALAPGQGNIYNLGSEQGFSVKEVLTTCEKVIGRKIAVEEAERRAGDPAVLVASSEKIRRELNWKPAFADLESIVGHAWAWHQKFPQGYATSSRS
jgi:UDP-glucose 4-epimerase